MAQRFYIYVLIDPRSGAVRYVGATNNPRRRLATHKSAPHSYPLIAWHDELRVLGLSPILLVVDEVGVHEVRAAERRLVSRCAKAGADLLNVLPGGGYTDHLRRDRRAARESRVHTSTVRTPCTDRHCSTCNDAGAVVNAREATSSRGLNGGAVEVYLGGTTSPERVP